jgi:hypothetical protein
MYSVDFLLVHQMITQIRTFYFIILIQLIKTMYSVDFLLVHQMITQTRTFYFIILIVRIIFERIASGRLLYDDCSCDQVKTPINFLCTSDSNPSSLLDEKRLYS